MLKCIPKRSCRYKGKGELEEGRGERGVLAGDDGGRERVRGSCSSAHCYIFLIFVCLLSFISVCLFPPFILISVRQSVPSSLLPFFLPSIHTFICLFHPSFLHLFLHSFLSSFRSFKSKYSQNSPILLLLLSLELPYSHFLLLLLPASHPRLLRPHLHPPPVLPLHLFLLTTSISFHVFLSSSFLLVLAFLPSLTSLSPHIYKSFLLLSFPFSALPTSSSSYPPLHRSSSSDSYISLLSISPPTLSSRSLCPQ